MEAVCISGAELSGPVQTKRTHRWFEVDSDVRPSDRKSLRMYLVRHGGDGMNQLIAKRRVSRNAVPYWALLRSDCELPDPSPHTDRQFHQSERLCCHLQPD
jgi:hypothetical protein